MLLPVKIILLALLTFCSLQDTRAQLKTRNGYTKLCHSLSKRATRLRKNMCSKEEQGVTVERKKRDAPVTDSTIKKSVATDASCKLAKTSRFDQSACGSGDLAGYNFGKKGIDLNLTFFIDGCWKFNVSWSPPHESDTLQCVGYRVRYVSQWSSPDTCFIVDKKTTSLVLGPSEGWEAAKCSHKIEIAVYPLPYSELRIRSYHRFDIPPPTEKTVTTLSTVARVGQQSNQSRESHNSDDNDEDEVNHKVNGLVLKVILSTVVVTVVVVIAIVVKARRQRSRQAEHELSVGVYSVCSGTEMNSECNYISYYNENEGANETAIKIASWLKDKQVNVVMDKFDVITSRKRVWCENHLSMAKRVIMIVSPDYLKICKFGETYEKEKKHDCFKQQLAWNEICQIRHKMMERPLATDRFIVVLVDTIANELPFWMRELKMFKYRKCHVLSENILTVLK